MNEYAMQLKDVTSSFADKNVLFVSPTVDLIVSANGSITAEYVAKGPWGIQQTIEKLPFLLPSLSVQAILTEDDWMAFLDSDGEEGSAEARRAYISVNPNDFSKPVAALSNELRITECFKIYQVAFGDNQLNLVLSRASNCFLTVRPDLNMDSEGRMYPITATSFEPDNHSLFAILSL